MISKEKQLQDFIIEKISLVQHMGVIVKSCTEEQVMLFAPLENNKNHLGTVFGGSQSALLTLCCWVWLYNKLLISDISNDIVVQKGTTNYLRPAETDFNITCKAPEDLEYKKFLSALSAKGKGRLHLQSQVITDRGVSSVFEGSFVVKVN